jgi:hypothetical protein
LPIFRTTENKIKKKNIKSIPPVAEHAEGPTAVIRKGGTAIALLV